jgi:hypothetical protein
MAFLDNSGDIILDAVLTDAGRQRLARGDGSFKIVQFALGDDEINYKLYNGTSASGSAYYDLDILQTPVLEAFTNNIASLNSKLLTIPRNNLLFLPIIKLHSALYKGTNTSIADNTILVTADETTETSIKTTNPDFAGNGSNGVIFGYSINDSDPIELHQGLDTNAINQNLTIDQDLKETQYTIEIDNRLGTIITSTSTQNSIVEADKSFVDDDSLAQYYFSLTTDNQYVKDSDSMNNTSNVGVTIKGPKGTSLKFGIRSSLEAQTSNYLFTTFGQSATIAGVACYAIKSVVTVTGITTGFSVSIPVTFIKKQ